jgi:hypothetical protein
MWRDGLASVEMGAAGRADPTTAPSPTACQALPRHGGGVGPRLIVSDGLLGLLADRDGSQVRATRSRAS